MASGLHGDCTTKIWWPSSSPGVSAFGIPGIRDERMARIVGYCNLQVLDESYQNAPAV
jgi:hypothetical protein